MKKYFLPFLSLLLILPSCNNSDVTSSLLSSEKPSSSEVGGDSSSLPSSSKEEFVPLELNAKNMIPSLKEIVSSNNFTFANNYILNYPSSRVFFTEKYLFYSDYKAGYLTLKSFDTEFTNSEELVYLYQMNAGTVNLMYPVTDGNIFSTPKPYTSLVSFNYMLDLDLSSLQENEFELKDGYLYTKNKALVRALASMAGYSADTYKDVFYKAKLKFDKNNNVEFILQMFNDAYEIVDVKSTHACFLNVNKTHYAPVETYLAENYEMNMPSLSLEEAAPLFFQNEKDVISLNNESYVKITGGEEGVVAKEEINRSQIEYEHTSIDVLTSRRLTNLVRNNEDGIPSYIGLDGENKLSEERFSKYYTWDYSYPSPTEFLTKQLKAFRKIGENQYRYYGYNQSSFFRSLCNFNGQNGIQWIDLFLVNKQIDHVVFTYRLGQDEYENGDTFTYQTTITCQLVKDRSITNPTPYEAKTENAILAKAFKKFNGTEKFQVTAVNDKSSYSRFITTYDLKSFVKEKDYYTGGGAKTFIDGYKKLDGSSYQRFLVGTDGVIKTNGSVTQGELSSLISFGLSPNIFAKTGENEYMFDSYILKGAKDKMILGSDEKYFLPSTFKLTVDPIKEEVVSAYYEYSDGISQSGSETLSFLYGEDVKLESSLEEKMSNLPTWVEPKTWKDEDPKIYSYLQKYFGDEADNVPYIYDGDVYSQWLASDSTLELEIYSNTQTADAASFFQKYREKLLASGFETTTLSSMPGATIYVKGNVSIRLASVLVGGIYLWKTGEAK